MKLTSRYPPYLWLWDFFLKADFANNKHAITSPTPTTPPSAKATIFSVFLPVPTTNQHTQKQNQNLDNNLIYILIHYSTNNSIQYKRTYPTISCSTINSYFKRYPRNPNWCLILLLLFLIYKFLFTWRWWRWEWSLIAGYAAWIISVADIAFLKIYLRRNRASTLRLRLLNGAFHTLHTVAAAQIAFTLTQHIHRLIRAGVKPAVPTPHAFHYLPQRRVQPVPKPSPTRPSRPADLVQQLGTAHLPEPGDLVPHIAAAELDPRRDCLPAELLSQPRSSLHAAVAVVAREIASALE